jgi:hypothetical protein
MKRVTAIVLLLGSICYGQGTPVIPYIDVFWRDIIDESDTETYGIDLSSGTWSSAVMNWDTTPSVYQNGAHLIKFDDTNFNILMGTGTGQGTPDEGTYNVMMGYEAGYNNDTTGGASYGDRNVYLGFRAGKGAANSTAYQNVFIGFQAGEDVTSGYSCVAIGAQALQDITSGSSNIAVGVSALENVTTGIYNFGLGTSAGQLFTIGNNNVLIGQAAMANSATSSSDNVAIGFEALKGAAADVQLLNVGIGTAAGKANMGTANVFVGNSSGTSNTTADYNTAIGHAAFYYNQTGSYNTVIGGLAGGYGAGAVNSYSNSTIIGDRSGYNITTGSSDVFLGYKSGYRQTTGSNLLIIDNQDRDAVANEPLECLIYGTFSDTVADQELTVNGNFKVGNATTGQESQFGDGGTTNYAQFAADGELTLAGTARVIKHYNIPLEATFGANAPTADTSDAPFLSWEFDINDDTHHTFMTPHDMDYTQAANVYVVWYTDTDQTDDEVNWQVQWNARAEGEAVNAGSTTDTSGDVACPTQWQVKHTLVETIAGNSIADDDVIGIDLTRIAIVDGTDPAANTIFVLAFHFEYTANKLGEAT